MVLLQLSGLTDGARSRACLEGEENAREAGGYVLFDVNLRSKMWGILMKS